ncbi:MAG: sigma-70 family RNA polymerase sigma factor [Anaerolineales bacterium]|nr:sigma-70 family RNA polymerase sigma factor [Anaerolineales bacterium]MDW8160593.1 sigma-70 family RNA polymerase sigma factor [Anaerolineales bacterium]
MDEQGLIRNAQRGDLEAFNRLVIAYQDAIYSYAYRMLGEESAADDATQETFLAAFQALRSFRGGSFRAWLFRIVTNQCYDELRRRQRHPTTPLEPLGSDDEEIESPRWIGDSSNSPEDQLDQQALRELIQHCLGELPDEFRSVILLVDVQGMDYAEAARALGKPVGTIKSRLARARLRVQRCLQTHWELLPEKFRPMNKADL